MPTSEIQQTLSVPWLFGRFLGALRSLWESRRQDRTVQEETQNKR